MPERLVSIGNDHGAVECALFPSRPLVHRQFLCARIVNSKESQMKRSPNDIMNFQKVNESSFPRLRGLLV